MSDHRPIRTELDIAQRQLQALESWHRARRLAERAADVTTASRETRMDLDRRLEVMTQPDVGAFALGVVPAVLLLRWAALAGGEVPALALVGTWAAARTVVAVVPALVPYARGEGLASPFLAGAGRWIALALLPAGALLVIASGWVGAAALAALVVAAAGVVGLARRRLGGFTGDVLGAAIVLGETAALLALAVER